jgi:hypothetical protein
MFCMSTIVICSERCFSIARRFDFGLIGLQKVTRIPQPSLAHELARDTTSLNKRSDDRYL